MKKSEITVSMPMITYDELMFFQTKYDEIMQDLKSCFNKEFLESEKLIYFDTNKALEVCKKHLPIRYKSINIVKTE